MIDRIDNESLENTLISLRESNARWTDGKERIGTAVPGLSLFKRYEPGVCTIAQGEKRVLLGNETYVYD